MKTIKWKALAALITIYVAAVMDWDWVWGVLFLMWTIPAFYAGRIHLVEEVERSRHPVLYWAIVGTWILLSLCLIFDDVWQLLNRGVP